MTKKKNPTGDTPSTGSGGRSSESALLDALQSALRILPSSLLLQPWRELLPRSQSAVLRPQACR